MKVIDASVAVKWFMEEPGRNAAIDLIRSGDLLVAPDIVVLEVLNVPRRKQRQGAIEAKQVAGAVEAMALCVSRLIPSTALAADAVRLSMELDHSVYDCACLACAVSLDVPLVTADRVFAEKALVSRPDYQIHMLEPQ